MRTTRIVHLAAVDRVTGHETGFTADGLTDRLGGRGIVPSHFQAGVVRGLGEAMVGTLYEYAGSFTYSITPSGASSG